MIMLSQAISRIGGNVQDNNGREKNSRRLGGLALKKKQINWYMADLYTDYEEGLSDSRDYSVMKDKYQTEYDNADLEEKFIISNMKKGKYCVPYALFGYCKPKEDIHKLEISPETVKVVLW